MYTLSRMSSVLGGAGGGGGGEELNFTIVSMHGNTISNVNPL